MIDLAALNHHFRPFRGTEGSNPSPSTRESANHRSLSGDTSDLLATVYRWFTEGFDTADLKQAKVLLDELA